MRVGSLCTGYGGIELGLALAGVDVDVRWVAEIDTVAKTLGDQAPNLGDIRDIDYADVEPVDLVIAGFPCQPVSAAGRQRGDADDRWRWPDVRRAVDLLRPSQFLLENVRNLVSTQGGALWAGILDDLAELGYDVRWLTLGACHVGAAHHRHRVFALATHVRTHPDGWMGPLPAKRVETSSCGVRSASEASTPTARDGDGRGEGDQAYWTTRANERNNGIPLGAAVALLPTPTQRDGISGPGHTSAEGSPNLRTAVTLLPTPTVQNWHGNRVNGRGELLLPGVAASLARGVGSSGTPRASDGKNGGPGQRGSSGDLAMPSAVQPENWGRFAAAVGRHESIYGRAPAPTEPNRNGAPRLAPAFAEWLMCIPSGRVTDVLDRRDALKAIGNGVCPPQLAAAWRLLTGGTP